MTEMKLSKSEYFDGIECDFYSDGKDAFMTREQIGAALGYADPIRAISKLHARKKDRLDKYSVVVKLTTTDGKTYDTRVYNRKGVMEICRHSDQPRADDFRGAGIGVYHYRPYGGGARAHGGVWSMSCLPHLKAERL